MLFEPRTEVKLVVGGDGQAGPTLPGRPLGGGTPINVCFITRGIYCTTTTGRPRLMKIEEGKGVCVGEGWG